MYSAISYDIFCILHLWKITFFLFRRELIIQEVNDKYITYIIDRVDYTLEMLFLLAKLCKGKRAPEIKCMATVNIRIFIHSRRFSLTAQRFTPHIDCGYWPMGLPVGIISMSNVKCFNKTSDIGRCWLCAKSIKCKY